MEKIISESIIKDIIKEINEEIAEPGFDGMTPATLGTVVPANAEGSTSSTDIAQQAPKTSFVKNAISKSLPYMIGFVQPLDGPVGFVFGSKQRQDTNINNPAPADNQPLDQIITRKLIETEIREIVLDFTNETVQDIEALFGNNFVDYFDKFQKSGGEIWDGPNGPMAKFFLEIGMQRMSAQINKDFITWLEKVATLKGQATIPLFADMANIYGIIGELRESLYKNTGKSGSCWVLVSPKIAAFLSSTIGSTMNNSAEVYNQGRRVASNKENGYVMTMGDIDVYQHNFYNTPDVTGGTSADSEDDGVIYMGFSGGPGVSSIYYTPYKEYIVQGGENFYTGQSNIFYRVRDAWSTNPLDTYDDSQVVPQLGINGQPDLREQNKSQYIVKADLIFSQKLIN